MALNQAIGSASRVVQKNPLPFSSRKPTKMALNQAIGSASRVVPLAIRASAGSQRYHHNSSVLFAAVNLSPSLNILQRSIPSSFHCYSTKPGSDASLLLLLESEIQCAAESQDGDEVEDVPKGFPFEIEDNPGQQTITLTREYEGESITVEVHMPDLVTDDENDEDDEEGGEGEHQSSLPLVVRVSKKTGPSLEFDCTAYSDEIEIDSLTINDPETSEDQIAYEGPDFGDLDENLQKAFHRYLEIRGVKPSLTNYLNGYMMEKDNREYVTWLKNLHEFVKA